MQLKNNSTGLNKNENNGKIRKLGEIIGFYIALLLFTTILFYVTKKFNILPKCISYFPVISIITLFYIFVVIIQYFHKKRK